MTHTSTGFIAPRAAATFAQVSSTNATMSLGVSSVAGSFSPAGVYREAGHVQEAGVRALLVDPVLQRLDVALAGEGGGVIGRSGRYADEEDRARRDDGMRMCRSIAVGYRPVPDE
jgi:hypothetical protein